MKTAVLLVSFGTSYPDARENSLEHIYRDFVDACKGIPIYQAYTSGIIIKKLSGQQMKISTVDEAVTELLKTGIERLYVIPTHMIPGSEYHKMTKTLEVYRTEFKELGIASAVLAEKEDCINLIPILKYMLKFYPEYEYILMGHGTEADANIRYEQMNEAFWQAGLTNVRIASVEAKPDLEDAIHDLRQKQKVEKVILHPFMVVAGDHAKNDMAGEENSYATALQEAGFQVETVVKGLGEYPQFRKIYINKLWELMK